MSEDKHCKTCSYHMHNITDYCENCQYRPLTEEYVWTINSNGQDTKVQKITRCKDCKYWDKSVYWENEKHEKQGCRCEKNNNIMTTADDFCSRGVRKDGEL